MKKVNYWAMVSGWWRGNGFQIIAVTTEKGGQVYGRDMNGCNTHRSIRDVLHRFTDEATAIGAADRANAERARLKPAVDVARKEYERLDREMSLAIMRAAKGGAR